MTVTCPGCRKPVTFDPTAVARGVGPVRFSDAGGKAAAGDESVTYYPVCTNCGKRLVVTDSGGK